MDIALLKIDTGKKLPYAIFGDSDNVKVGEWVLAVGNPYNLTSTVTAGIISAKARNLDQRGIQSFIQTDAAVNPGNSGGALVNTRGELIGINTMISSMTGSYVGYSFAVPSNITRKIIEDIMEYGNVQRGVFGVEGYELNSTITKDMGLSTSQGYYVKKVVKNSGAAKAGIQEGDILIKLDNTNISSYVDLSSYVNTKRPNDVVKATFIRNGKAMQVPVTITKNEFVNAELNGIIFENLDASDKKRFNIDYGVKVKDITNKHFMRYYNALKGNILIGINDAKAVDTETVANILNEKLSNESVVELTMINKQGVLVKFFVEVN